MAAPVVYAQADWTQERWNEVELATEKVSEKIYLFRGIWNGNIAASIGEDGVFLIDDQFAPLTEKLLAEIRKLSDQPVKYVINTHFHSDHMGGNENLGKRGSVIIAHDEVRKRLAGDDTVRFMNKPSAPAGLPVITFNNSLSLHMNGEDVRVTHVSAAHTDGDSIIHFTGSDVIHMEDVYFSRGLPYIDVVNGGSINGMINAVDVALGLSDEKTRIIAGHGPVTGKAELEVYRRMMLASREAVLTEKRKGRSLDETLAVAADIVGTLPEPWSRARKSATVRYITSIYTSLP